MRIAMLQNNYVVGDLVGNAAKIASSVHAASQARPDLCLCSELSLLGYPPLDLLLNKGFIDASWRILKELAQTLRKTPPVLVGLAEPNTRQEGRPLWNSAALLAGGEVKNVFHKTLLPTYDVFDEDRYFEPFDEPGWFELGGLRIGVTICEDIWNDKDFWKSRRYRLDPIARLASQGVHCIVNLSASPFHLGKHAFRQKMLSELARKHGLPLIYVNQVGGNDDLVFDGRSSVFSAAGALIATGKAFAEDLVVADLDSFPGKNAQALEQQDEVSCQEQEAWKALILGTGDYLRKTGFSKALLGISGGIDSSLVAAIAAHALGPENVLGVLLPSPYTSSASIEDALELAANLGIKSMTIPIDELMTGFDQALKSAFAGRPADVTEENIQARIRGNLLMALSNKFKYMLLTTGNKSELAVGYCTMYGDMAGGLAVIADVPKSLVYALARWLNATHGRVIPERVISRPPSAELRPNQTDQDSLPAYADLDEILQRYVQEHRSDEEIIRDGFDPDVVQRVVKLIKAAEFKRRQAAPGLKITDVAFGSGWRMPIAAHWPL
ncbi:MAG TPA: NAD+ synthase [Desulfonatronum sp.]|nr:NAD+ synthase [Desulfonatronum sp.]